MFFCYHQGDKRETIEKESLGTLVLTSSPLPWLASIFLFPWVTTGSQWGAAGMPRQAQIFANWLAKKHIWTWLTNSESPIVAFFKGGSNAHSKHAAVPAAQTALWPLKHAKARWQKACKLIQRDSRHRATRAVARKINNWKQRRTQRNWFKLKHLCYFIGGFEI